MNELTKVCRGCLLEIPTSNFYKSGNAVGGGIVFHSRCKDCHKEYNKRPGIREKLLDSWRKSSEKHREKHREKRNAYYKEYYLRKKLEKEFMEKRRAYNKEYRLRKKLEKELVKMSIKKDRLSISEENKVCIECFEEKSYSHFFPDFISEGIAYPIRVCRKCYEETHIRYAKKMEKSVDK